EEIWPQAWSEPDAGSDMAAIRSRGRLSDDGTEWILDGQKIWASRAVWADWCFGIFRTDPDSARHRGLTFILIPLDTPGVTVRPIAQLDGDTGFAEIFFDGARVPVENTLGPVGGGWGVAMATAGFERG
ncbi:MAG TPA: acyl-CoA dehydrogenase family protein, partial [Ilumatobacteraceae bacterium]|nr:acyl-CoA dehydrogenase family protein [Ilumatobacteraceae bacterium]